MHSFQRESRLFLLGLGVATQTVTPVTVLVRTSRSTQARAVAQLEAAGRFNGSARN